MHFFTVSDECIWEVAGSFQDAEDWLLVKSMMFYNEVKQQDLNELISQFDAYLMCKVLQCSCVSR